jgi:hypothetical protein
VTLRKLHSTAPHGSANSAAYHIVYREGQYKVFDKAGRFRVGFATLPAAQTYIDMRSGAASHNNALSDEGMKVAV